MAEITYLAALTAALADEMRHDVRVVVIGEDVAEGGPFGATKGLVGEFGEGRVRDTPISESAVMGVSIGMALAGWRPVIEIMFIDFITLALDQLVNQAAKARYMSGGQLRVPLVVRTQGGAGMRSGAQHSQSLEAWLVHVPGLAVVMPSNAADAASLLRAAIRADDPVVIVENKALYNRRSEVGGEAAELGHARVRRPGRDVTIVATSRLVDESLSAAEALAADGIEAEVIDPCTLQPLDRDTIFASVSRTGRCVVAHEAVTIGGFGAEVAATIQEAAFDHLDAPIIRVGAPFAPVPVSPPLEDAFVPGATQIAAAVHALVGR